MSFFKRHHLRFFPFEEILSRLQSEALHITPWCDESRAEAAQTVTRFRLRSYLELKNSHILLSYRILDPPPGGEFAALETCTFYFLQRDRTQTYGACMDDQTAYSLIIGHRSGELCGIKINKVLIERPFPPNRQRDFIVMQIRDLARSEFATKQVLGQVS